eukprot:g2934.t1
MDDDDLPLLSEEASAALIEVFTSATHHGEPCKDATDFTEDWRLSQFWYTEETADVLCSEIESQLNEGSVACVSCPTIFRRLITRCSRLKRTLFEYDRRFSSLENFVFYDYNEPQEVPEEYHHDFDVVIADPPYLSEECLTKTLDTVQLLLKNRIESRIYLLTGEVMQEVALKKAKLKPVKFRPQHKNKLGNEFMLYTNKEPSNLLGGYCSVNGKI